MPRPWKRPTIYTVPEAAELLGRSENTVRDQIAKTGAAFRSASGGTLLLEERDVESLREYKPPRGPRKRRLV